MDRDPTPEERPADVTSSAMILIVLGIFGLFANAIVFVNADRVTQLSTSLVSLAAGAGVLVAGLEIASGVMVLRLRNTWRIVGIVIAALGAALVVLNMFWIGAGVGSVLVTAANVYVVVTLIRLRRAFV